jgi:proline iminopeptidase
VNIFLQVLFDQRGSGKSTPTAELRDNNTWSLVDDMEALRLHLGIERWVVFGGSWGSTLALTYAIKHKNRVFALIVSGLLLLDIFFYILVFFCLTSSIYWSRFYNV